jgi:MAPEG family
MSEHQNDADMKATRRAIVPLMLVAAPLTIALWLGLFHLLPPVPDMLDRADRMVFALKCCCVAILLCFVTGVEAVAHERLTTPAFDPLAGRESHRMKVNLQYLQNTLEQLLIFIPGLVALSCYCAGGEAMRAVVATTVVWVLARAVFWIGYHRAPGLRVPGLVGMVQSLLVLLYVCGKFGYEVGGLIGAIVPLAIFASVEGYLVYMLRSRASAR